MEIEILRAKASTARGARLLRSKDAKNEEIQDKTKPMEVIGADVESLYPSLDCKTVANLVYKAILETDITFANVNYKEAVRYIALMWTKQECRMSDIRRVLPWRASKSGARPGITGEGPLGPGEGKVEQWIFPKVELTDLEMKKIIGRVLQIAVETMFCTHIYKFGNKFYLQQRGGPIGLRATCGVARLTMIMWDRLWLEMVSDMGLNIEDAARYMDDLRLFMFPVREGWRWVEGELCWTKEWENEDLESGKSDLERTSELVRQSLNKIYPFLNFTIESAEDFEDRRLPTLDFKLWVSAGNIVLYTFFEKPTSSNQMLHRNTALSENTKMATMNAEIVRRMMNVSENLPIQERTVVLDNVAQKLTNSGYNMDEIRKGMVGALTGYERKLEASKKSPKEKGYKPLHEGAEGSHGKRMRKKLTGKSSWFKKPETERKTQEDNTGGVENRGIRKQRRQGDEAKKKSKVEGKQMETTRDVY